MSKQRKSKWKQQTCGCVKAELPNAGKVVIRCTKHRDKPSKSERTLCYWDSDGLARAESADAPERRKRELLGVQQVYFAQLGELIKIGLSNDPEIRVRGLNATLLATIKGDRELEKKMHRKFADLLERGEWYRAEEPLVSWIKGLSL